MLFFALAAIIYHVSADNPGPGNLGVTRYNPTTKKIDVVIGSSDIGTLAHELRHAYGFEVGEIAYLSSGSPGPILDLTDEIHGIEIGYLFRGREWANFALSGKVTPDFMKNTLEYKGLVENNLSLSSQSSELLQKAPFIYYPNLSVKDVMRQTNEELIRRDSGVNFIYNDVLRVKK